MKGTIAMSQTFANAWECKMTNKKTSYKPSPWNANSELGKAVIELDQINKAHGVIMKGGKKYTMVKDRVEIFRKYYLFFFY